MNSITGVSQSYSTISDEEFCQYLDIEEEELSHQETDREKFPFLADCKRLMKTDSLSDKDLFWQEKEIVYEDERLKNDQPISEESVLSPRKRVVFSPQIQAKLILTKQELHEGYVVVDENGDLVDFDNLDSSNKFFTTITLREHLWHTQETFQEMQASAIADLRQAKTQKFEILRRGLSLPGLRADIKEKYSHWKKLLQMLYNEGLQSCLENEKFDVIESELWDLVGLDIAYYQIDPQNALSSILSSSRSFQKGLCTQEWYMDLINDILGEGSKKCIELSNSLEATFDALCYTAQKAYSFGRALPNPKSNQEEVELGLADLQNQDFSQYREKSFLEILEEELKKPTPATPSPSVSTVSASEKSDEYEDLWKEIRSWVFLLHF